NILDQVSHDFGYFLAVLPQLCAVAVITGDGYGASAGSLDGADDDIGGPLAQGRSDTREMKPVCTVKNVIPIKVMGCGYGDSGLATVINNLGGALVRSSLEIINAHPIALAQNERSVDAITPQKADAGIGNRVCRKHGNECGVEAKNRQ